METKNPKLTISAVAGANYDTPKYPLTAAAIQAWIVSYLAQLLEIQPDEIDTEIPFDQYGLDSSAAVGMTGDLEDWMGRKIDPTLLYDYPTIQALAQHLAE
ncbi:MAG TPA: phosphopantetheine-binding protein [Cyanobacteria bacterium UBA11372]|nr:phosphopantetheine-binding protein [Cyanobacteria bacterium UBA11372]